MPLFVFCENIALLDGELYSHITFEYTHLVIYI